MTVRFSSSVNIINADGSVRTAPLLPDGSFCEDASQAEEEDMSFNLDSIVEDHSESWMDYCSNHSMLGDTGDDDDDDSVLIRDSDFDGNTTASFEQTDLSYLQCISDTQTKEKDCQPSCSFTSEFEKENAIQVGNMLFLGSITQENSCPKKTSDADPYHCLQSLRLHCQQRIISSLYWGREHCVSERYYSDEKNEASFVDPAGTLPVCHTEFHHRNVPTDVSHRSTAA